MQTRAFASRTCHRLGGRQRGRGHKPKARRRDAPQPRRPRIQRPQRRWALAPGQGSVVLVRCLDTPEREEKSASRTPTAERKDDFIRVMHFLTGRSRLCERHTLSPLVFHKGAWVHPRFGFWCDSRCREAHTCLSCPCEAGAWADAGSVPRTTAHHAGGQGGDPRVGRSSCPTPSPASPPA